MQCGRKGNGVEPGLTNQSYQNRHYNMAVLSVKPVNSLGQFSESKWRIKLPAGEVTEVALVVA